MARGRDEERKSSSSSGSGSDDDNNSDSDSSTSSTSGSDGSTSAASGLGSSSSSGPESGGSGSGGGSDDDDSKDGSNFEVSFWQSMKAVMPWTKEGEEARNRNTWGVFVFCLTLGFACCMRRKLRNHCVTSASLFSEKALGSAGRSVCR